MARYTRNSRSDRQPSRLSRAGAQWHLNILNHTEATLPDGDLISGVNDANPATIATHGERTGSPPSADLRLRSTNSAQDDNGLQMPETCTLMPSNPSLVRARVASATVGSPESLMISGLSIDSPQKPQVVQLEQCIPQPPWSAAEIHPLFLEDRFCQEMPYGAIFPALKLATRLISTPQATYYLHAIFFGVNRAVPDLIAEELHPTRAMSELTTRDQKLVWNELAAMASDTRIVVRKELRQKCLSGQTRYKPSLLTGDRRRTPSLISINPELIDPLRQDEKFMSDFRARNVLNLAITLVHEVAHAAQAWAVGGYRAEDYFQDSPCAEAGWEIERQIFGGVVSIPDWGESRHIAFIRRWPTRSDGPRERSTRNAERLAEDQKWPIEVTFLRALQSETWWLETSKHPRNLIPRSVQTWIESCRQTNTSSGVPATLEGLCNSSPINTGITRRAQMSKGELKPRTRAVAHPPRFYLACCVRSLQQFKWWAAGNRPATTCDDIVRWRKCLWWLRPAKDQSAPGVWDKALGLMLGGIVPVWTWTDFSQADLQHLSAWPMDHTPRTFFPAMRKKGVPLKVP
ncbi:hypothetical protein B0A48_02356 [Cryoendolithus antarcticus]|uniref:Uncharacterized protein n=1 Tax=Cryoendolithus antarcticus TaxID=1507870 RepID=A0A1V8TNV8_9PEZI|nr:hypothetical protein B0A48_02356 [Cryoendolithus antarcticus]